MNRTGTLKRLSSVPAVSLSTSVGRAADRCGRGVETIAVLRAGRPWGELQRRELELAVHHGLDRLAVGQVACRRAETIPAAASVEQVRRRFAESGAGLLFVGRRGVLQRRDFRERHGGLPEPAPGAPATRALARALTARQRRLLRCVAQLASKANAAVCLVGGPVRDLLLGRPVADLDLVLETDVVPIAQALARRFGGDAVVHRSFGTASVRLRRGDRLDLARARAERYAHAGALPRVAPAGLPEDLARRDFTVNALALRLDRSGPVELVDPWGGLRDLRERRLRVLHGLSFVEDPTRALRAARFAVRFGFTVDEQTARLIPVARRVGAFERVSPVRLGRELLRLLDEPRLGAAVAALIALGLPRALHSGWTVPAGRLRSLRVLERQLARMARSRPADVRQSEVVLAWLAGHLKGPSRERLAGRLGLGASARRLLLDGTERATGLLRRLPRGRRHPSSAVYRACRGHRPEVVLLALARSARAPARRDLRRWIERLRFVDADIRGSDLLNAGVPSGPLIARGLQAALEAKLDGRARGRSGQIAAALRVVGAG